MPSVDRMHEFLAVTRAGSISAAARTLALPRATLSRRISALEADLGVRLIHRRTTKLVLTDAGQELQRRAGRIVDDADAAWNAVRRLDDVPRGLLRVSVTGPHFSHLFTRFLCDFPEISLEVQSTTRHVDLLAEGVDVAIRIGPIRDQNLIARTIHRDRTIVVATPGYLQHAGKPERAEDLAGHSCIVGFAGDWAPNRTWPRRDGGIVRVGGRMAANEVELVRQAALDGIGLALLPSALVADDIKAGALTPVLTAEIGADLPISIVYADRDYIDAKVRQFVDRAAKVITQQMPKPLPAQLL